MENLLIKKTLLAALLATCAAEPVLAQTYRPINNAVYALQDPGEWTEAKVVLPPYPLTPEWVGFYVPQKNDYQYFVDAKTLTVGGDGVIRLILRVTSASGAENLSYEGIHCGNRNLRSYAFGDSFNHQWIESTRAIWKRMDRDDKVRMRLAEDFCPDWKSPKTAADALSQLKSAPWR